MAADEPIDWELGNAPKQSITELLHNPRGPKLELPDVTLELPALSLTPVPPISVPEPLNINHFESYLRHYAPLYESYQAQKTAVIASPLPLDTVPSHYFQSDFSLATNDELSSLSSEQPLSDNPYLMEIRHQLARHKTTLEHHLRRVLDEQTPALTEALRNIQQLREAILSTSTALRETRESAEKLLPTVIAPIAETQRLTQAQTNLRKLKSALQSMQLVTSAPSDIAILLEAGEYSAAIEAVHSAREELAHPHLARITALASVRARLAQSVESIDNALRGQFRHALADANQPLLREVVALVSHLGRLNTLHRFFMREIKDRLSKSISDVANVSQAAKVVTASAESAVMLVGIIHDDVMGDKSAKREHLREAYSDFEEMAAGVANRALGSFTGGTQGGFIVIRQPETLTPETCFDEFKAALRFGEEIRSLDELATEMEHMFCIEKRGGALRAKISERQIAFVSSFHKAHTDALTEAVRVDKWQEIHVPNGAVRLLASVLDLPKTPLTDGDGNGIIEAGNRSSEGTERTSGTVVIGSSSFKTVACGVRYVRSICAYTLLAEKSPVLASEIARRGADYCRHFNSLIGKAILGAAALQWAGLRSITARHLSLASRTIAMAVTLAEHVNKPLENALSGVKADVILQQLQKSEKDLRDHHAQLLAKILAIMMDRLEAHETTLKSLPWDKYEEMQRFEMPSDYVVILSKEATVLHRILWAILPRSEVFDIFQRVCAAYGTHLTEAYSALDGGKRWIRIRVARDVECLHERLLVLDAFKVNPESFKPLSKLYGRFSKECLEEETRNPGGKSFNRRSQRQSSTPISTTASIPKSSTSKANDQEPRSDTTEAQNDHGIGKSRENLPEGDNEISADSQDKNPIETGRSVHDGSKQPAQNTAKRKIGNKEETTRESHVKKQINSVTTTERNEDVQSSFHSCPSSLQMEKPVDPNQSSDPKENGHMDSSHSCLSEDRSPIVSEGADGKGDTTLEDGFSQKCKSAALDSKMEGSRIQEKDSVAEGDLLNLGDDG